MKRLTYLVLLMVLSLLLSSCTNPLLEFQRCQSTADWVDFIQLNGLQYLHSYENDGVLSEDDLGEPFASIQYRVAEGCREGPIRDGDAAFLASGTKLYTVKGYDPRFRLAAFRDDQLLLFDVDSNPNAKIGSDVLDLQGKVKTIEILETSTTQSLATIENPDIVNALVRLALEARANPDNPMNEPDYIIVFHLRDGTRVSRAYDKDTPFLWRGIQVDPQFTEIIQEATE